MGRGAKSGIEGINSEMGCERLARVIVGAFQEHSLKISMMLWRNLGREVVMESPQQLRARAERYRYLASIVSDAQAIEALRELATQYDAAAAALEAASHALDPDNTPD